MTDRLDVHLFDRPVGMLSIEGELRSPGDWCFVYDTGYQSSDEAVPLSVALPLQPPAASRLTARKSW